MTDIQSRQDIIKVVKIFYEKVHQDQWLAPIFEEIDFEKHLPVVYNFWDNMLFHTGNYGGGMMWVHLQQNEKTPLTAELFERWLTLFTLTINENFSGENAEFMKKKATEVGLIMQAKMQAIQNQQQ